MKPNEFVDAVERKRLSEQHSTLPDTKEAWQKVRADTRSLHRWATIGVVLATVALLLCVIFVSLVLCFGGR